MKRFCQKHKTLLLYLAAGGLTTLSNYLLFFLFRYMQGAEFNIIALLRSKSEDGALFSGANIPAVIGSVLIAYPLNKRMVFRTKHESRKALFREMGAFFSSRAVTVLLEIGASALLVEVLGFPELSTKLAVTAAVILLNYLLSVTLVFRGK